MDRAGIKPWNHGRFTSDAAIGFEVGGGREGGGVGGGVGGGWSLERCAASGILTSSSN